MFFLRCHSKQKHEARHYSSKAAAAKKILKTKVPSKRKKFEILIFNKIFFPGNTRLMPEMKVHGEERI